MRTSFRHRNQSLIFRQWSRKKYAIFSSLGKEIHIGHVDVDICDKALNKSSDIEIEAYIQEISQCENDDEEALLTEGVDIQLSSCLILTSNLDDSSRCCRSLSFIHILNHLTCSLFRELELLYNKFKDEKSIYNKF